MLEQEQTTQNCNCENTKKLKEDIKKLKSKIKELETENNQLRLFIGVKK